MIARIWHGYTTKENANAYTSLLKDEIFDGIADKKRYDKVSAHFDLLHELKYDN